jgi:pSer/pThr/pTyr-binding forkhead associated (FHA) protein
VIIGCGSKEDEMTKTQYRLVVRQGPIPGQVFECDRNEISIGRDIANDFVINDAEISRRHARLTLEEDRYKIEDLNSTNGTYIDGQRLIGPHIMAIGEIIMLGDNVGVVFEGEPAPNDITIASTIDLGSTPVAAIPAPIENPVQPVTPIQPILNQYPKVEVSIPEIEPEIPVEIAKKPINTWLLAGCGCLVVIMLLIIAVIVFIDQPWSPEGGLYCRIPFDIIFGALGFCP